MTLAGVIGATRFKFAHQGHLLKVNCPRCRKHPDGYEHMLDCYSIREEEAAGIGAVDFLAALAVKVTTIPPNLIFPIMTAEEGD